MAHPLVRECILASEREARVARETWRCRASTYQAYRAFIGYSYTVGFIIDETDHQGVTALSFGNVRSDLIAFASKEGHIYILHLPPARLQSDASPSSKPLEPPHFASPSVLRCSKIHALRVNAIDWSFENSQLFSVGDDGGVCFFDASSGDCIRSIATRTPLRTCKLHKTLLGLAFTGNTRGTVEVLNCSSGTSHSKVSLPGTANLASLPPPATSSAPEGVFKKKSTIFRYPPLAPHKGMEVTAIEASNHHLFVGDSSGHLHLYRLDMKQDGQLQKLSEAKEFVPFCRTTDTPILLCTCSDGTFAIVRVLERQHRLDLHLSTSCPYPHACPAVVCPLSSIQDVPRLVTGSSDGHAYVLDVSSGSRPFAVSTLRGHRAPLLCVGLSFDEAFLASGSEDGKLIIWRRGE